MPKDKKDRSDFIVARGQIVEANPGARFKVKLENGHILNATISGRIRKNNIQMLLGDQVEVEMSPYDLTLGRISYRY